MSTEDFLPCEPETDCFLCGGPFVNGVCEAYHWHDAIHLSNRAAQMAASTEGPMTYEFLDRQYATREEWHKAFDSYKKEPAICAHCLHPVDYDIDADEWRHKEAVPWCDAMRGARGAPIHGVVNGSNG